MPLPPDKIDEVRGKACLLEVARAHTAMRKQGHNWVGCCPFHRERTPSFSVHPDKQLFYCFGCQRGGDVFAFVMQTSGIDFQAAVRQLAERTGVQLAPLSPEQARRAEALRQVHAANKAAQQQLQRALWDRQSGAGKEVRNYLSHRGITPATARQFGLGYGADGAELRRTLVDKGFAPEQLVDVGLLGEVGALPWLSGRLTFPIDDLAGNILGFGARRLDDGQQGPKYLNSRENVAFHKGAQLFALAAAASSIRHRKEVLLVEGYFDVLALHQAGATHAVAALGTQLTRAHGETLARLAQTATLLLDADAAGLRASFRAAQVLLQCGLQVQLVQLPSGEDPASLAQKQGVKALLHALASPEPAVASFVRRAFAPATTAGDITIERKVAAALRLMPLLDCLQGLEKTLYVRRVAEHVGVAVDELLAHWRAAPKGDGSDKKAGLRRAHLAGAGPQGGRGGIGAGGEHGPLLPDQRGAPGAAAAGRTAAFGRQAAHRGPDGAQAATRTGLRGAASGRGAPAGAAGPAALAAAIDRRELALVRELLLFPSAFARLGEIAPLLSSPPLRTLLEKLASPETPDDTTLTILTQCIDVPAVRAQLAQIRPFVGQTLDEVTVRANRTFADIQRRLRLRAVDDAMRAVLGELAAAEARGDATDALVRRKQQLTAEKRALRGAQA